MSDDKGKKQGLIGDIVDIGKKQMNDLRVKYPGLRKNREFSNYLFIISISILFILTLVRKIETSVIYSENPIGQWLLSRVVSVSTIITLTAIFSIWAIGLNLHTGVTGMVNFGVIFFAGIGAVTTGLLISKYNADPLISILFGMILAGIIGYLLAYPTIRLRIDYFAIVTIALGEILRITLKVETSLWSRTSGAGIDSPGIAGIKGPLTDWWKENALFNLPYTIVLSIIAILATILSYAVAQSLINSSYGRVLKSIREDEDVSRSYGYDVFQYKAVILGIGSMIMALGGGIWAWQLGNIFPESINPVSTTFFVWAAFILGGKGNNKGMIVGAWGIVLLEQFLRNVPTTPNTKDGFFVCLGDDGFFACGLDTIFRWLLIDVGGALFGKSSYQDFFTTSEENIHLPFIHLRFIFLGLIIIISMRKFNEGFLPELPYRPNVDYKTTEAIYEGFVKCPNCGEATDAENNICPSCGEDLSGGKSE